MESGLRQIAEVVRKPETGTRNTRPKVKFIANINVNLDEHSDGNT